MKHRLLSFLPLLLAAAACTPLPEPAARPATVHPQAARVAPQAAAQNFVAVVDRMEPVIERECRARLPGANCDFQIAVDDDPGAQMNAYQTVARDGRPVIVFTLPLIADARNRDEVAFVMGHEAAHHIAGHLPRTQQTAIAGALILGTLATLGGVDAAGVDAAQNIGATVGARSYSKGYELEADQLGTVLAWRAGFDPERGMAFFNRIPDPGNKFLGSHPPTGARQQVVAETLARIRAGQVR